MNPSELRMMWMSQYTPDRISLEDAATFFGHPSVGLSVMDDLAAQQQQLDLNPMMGLVGSDFSNQAAAAAAAVAASNAAAALGVQPAALLAATNTNEIYGLAHMGGLHQHLLQQSAAAFQNYTDMMNDDDDGNVVASTSGMSIGGLGGDMSGVVGTLGDMPMPTMTDENSVGGIMDETGQLHQQSVYDQMDDTYDDGIDELTPKQEIINIDDFVMMNDSNSYDESEFTAEDQTIMRSITNPQTLDDSELLAMPISSRNAQLLHNVNMFNNAKLNMLQNSLSNSNSASPTNSPSHAASHATGNGNGGGSTRSQRKTRKIEPVNRPGLVLKTPIAYKGNIDPSVIPIQKDGMAVCERCGAIGVKHTFYTKSRRFCSMSCARGELYSLVLNNKVQGGGQPQQQKSPKHDLQQNEATVTTNPNNNSNINNKGSTTEEINDNNTVLSAIEGQQPDIELALRVAHIKNSNYRFRLADTQINQHINENSIGTVANNAMHLMTNECVERMARQMNGVIDITENSATATLPNELIMSNETATNAALNNNNNINSPKIDNLPATTTLTTNENDAVTATKLMPPPNAPTKPLRMYRDVMPQEELPQIRKFDQLPSSSPELDKILSARKRNSDTTLSYDWTPRLSEDNCVAAPVTCFKHAPGYDMWDNLDIDMKVEVENTDCDYDEIILPGQHVRSFWVASILKICGYKALVRYEGFDNRNSDFWVNLCNAEVHAVGWCATRGKPLIPPITIAHKYRDWKDFLVARLSGARTLPTNFYNKINDSLNSRFRVGINLECVDKDHISQVRLATITKIVGKRLYLRYFDSEDGFWCHEDSPIIHPVGWATTVGHNLSAPQDYLQRMLAGRNAMIEVHEDDGTIELFKMNFTFEEYYLDGKTNSFMEGMKIEAVDPLNLSSVCAATVMAVLKFGYIMIRIDSYKPDATNSDWFCYHEKSPSIFPVGFCQSNGIELTPPSGYESKAFNWDNYLQETGSIPAPQHLFHRIVPDHHFEVGMSLECADLMDPRLVCVASVMRVVGRLLRIHFDGWTEDYDQWLDCESPDIYPVGWCVLVNHKLEGPPTTQQVNNAKVPTGVASGKSKAQRRRKKKGAVGVGTVAGTSTAATIINPNALTSSMKPAKQQQVVKPQDPQPQQQQQMKTSKQKQMQTDASSVKPRTIPLRTNPDQPKLSIKLELKPEHYNAAYYDNNNAADDDEDDSDDEVEYEATSIAVATTSTKKVNKSVLPINTQIKSSTKVADKLQSSISPHQQQPQQQRIKTNSTVSSSKYIPRLSDCSSNDASSTSSGVGAGNEQIGDLVPETWNIYDVSQFLRVNDCTAHCETFGRNKIDGKRLLQLSKDEVITLLGMKVGPALKIYDLIQQLKCKVNPNKSRQQLHKPNKSLTSSYF